MEVSLKLKYSFTNEIYQQMVQEKEERKYHRKELEVSETTLAVSGLIEEMMAGEYRSMKKRYGVTVEPKEDVN